MPGARHQLDRALSAVSGATAKALAGVARATRLPYPSCLVDLRSLNLLGAVDLPATGVMDLGAAKKYSFAPPRISILAQVGSTAKLRVNGSRKTVSVVYAKSGWRIAKLDFSDVPRG
jgi:hypothetical protein